MASDGGTAPTGARRWLATPVTKGQLLAVVAVVLVVAELWARAVGPYLPPSELGDAPEMALKLEQMQAVGSVDVVLVGNSMVAHGLDPARLEQADPALGTVYNAALAGAPLVGIERWTDDYVVPNLAPDTIVLGLNPVSLININPIDGLNGGTAAAAAQVIENRFLEALARLEPTALQRADQRAGEVSALIRDRATLRNPKDALRGTWSFVTGEDPGEGVPTVALDQGALVARDESFWRRYLTVDGFASQIGDRRSEDIDNPDHVARLREVLQSAEFDRTGVRHLLRSLARQADRVVVAIMPLAPGMLAALGDDAAVLDEGVAILERAAADVDADVVDLRDAPVTDDGFADPAHLNVPGADLLSDALAARL